MEYRENRQSGLLNIAPQNQLYRAFTNWVRNDTHICANMALVKILVYPYCFNWPFGGRVPQKREKGLLTDMLVVFFLLGRKRGKF